MPPVVAAIVAVSATLEGSGANWFTIKWKWPSRRCPCPPAAPAPPHRRTAGWTLWSISGGRSPCPSRDCRWRRLSVPKVAVAAVKVRLPMFGKGEMPPKGLFGASTIHSAGPLGRGVGLAERKRLASRAVRQREQKRPRTARWIVLDARGDRIARLDAELGDGAAGVHLVPGVIGGRTRIVRACRSQLLDRPVAVSVQTRPKFRIGNCCCWRTVRATPAPRAPSNSH